MKLAELQALFQDSILTGEREILRSVLPSRRLDAAARFEVYADAYRYRLAEFLSNDYPVLRNALGDDEFGALVEAYIEAMPSLHQNARWYGYRLPQFMRETEPWSARRAWYDLAHFERALADAFDAADADVLDIESLATTPAEEWPRLRFQFHPSVALLRFAAGTVANYAEAVADDAEPLPHLSAVRVAAELVPQVEEVILVWRKEGQSFYRSLDEDETLALHEIQDGKTFGEMCSLLAFRHVDEDVSAVAANFLVAWFRDGLVASLAPGAGD